MSIKSALIGLFLFVGAIGLAYMLHVSTRGSVYSTRTPASEETIHLKGIKPEILRPEKGHKHRHTQKLKGPISLALTSSEESKNHTLPITLTIQSSESLDNVHVKWIIPDGVRLVSGNIEERISINPDTDTTLTIHVQKLNEANHQIHARADGSLGPIQFSEIAQFNTSHRHLNQARKKEVLQKNSHDEEPDANSLFKVFQ